MYSLIVLTALTIFTIFYYYKYLTRLELSAKKEVDQRRDNFQEHKKKFNSLIIDISTAEEKIHNILKLYEINRKISHILDTSELLKVFPEELNRIEQIHDVALGQNPVNKSEEEQTPDSFEFKIKSKTQEWRLTLKCSELLLQSQLPYLISQFKLLLDRAQMYQQLQQISITDALTLLPNKKHFLDRLAEEFSRSDKFNLSLTFCMIDIDYFKRYNDTYGHLVGDEILHIISKIIKDNIREIDLPGRFGGEEFCIFLPETSKSQALPVAERLRSEIEKYSFSVYDETVNLTISIGISGFPEDTKNLDQLIEKADQALYKAKKTGRNRVCMV